MLWCAVCFDSSLDLIQHCPIAIAIAIPFFPVIESCKLVCSAEQTRQRNMENNSSYAPNFAVNLKHLPPIIDPFRISNPSSKGKLNNSCNRAAAKAKAVRRSPNQGMKVVDSDKEIVKNPSLGKIVIQEASSTSFHPKFECCGNTTSPTQSQTEQEGLKKGHARSTLYEICAANHWKPPVFECCKEEGPSHRRMFTFKVVVEIEASRNIIECYGAPHPKKKAAADHAAEGALLYLKVCSMCSEKPNK